MKYYRVEGFDGSVWLLDEGVGLCVGGKGTLCQMSWSGPPPSHMIEIDASEAAALCSCEMLKEILELVPPAPSGKPEGASSFGS